MSEEIKLPSFIQIFGLQPVQNGTSKTGRAYSIQKASCQLLDEEGVQMQVAILRLPAADVGNIKPGIYRPAFGLRIDYQNNEVAPVLLSLTPMPTRQSPAAVAAAKS